MCFLASWSTKRYNLAPKTQYITIARATSLVINPEAEHHKDLVISMVAKGKLKSDSLRWATKRLQNAVKYPFDVHYFINNTVYLMSFPLWRFLSYSFLSCIKNKDGKTGSNNKVPASF